MAFSLSTKLILPEFLALSEGEITYELCADRVTLSAQQIFQAAGLAS